MNARKVRIQPNRANALRAKRRKEFAEFERYVKATLRLMYNGEPIRMIVSVVDMRGPAIAIQTVNGRPFPPPPPNPPSIMVGPIDIM